MEDFFKRVFPLRYLNSMIVSVLITVSVLIISRVLKMDYLNVEMKFGENILHTTLNLKRSSKKLVSFSA